MLESRQESCGTLSKLFSRRKKNDRRVFSVSSPHIPDGESFSCNTFCQLACGMLKAIGNFLNSGIDDVISRMFVYPDSESSEDEASTRHQVEQAFSSIFMHQASEIDRFSMCQCSSLTF